LKIYEIEREGIKVKNNEGMGGFNKI